MKKVTIFVLAIALVAISQAASITWNATTTTTKFNGTSVGKNAVGYIVYLGSNTIGSSGYAFSDIIQMSAVKENATSLGKWNKLGVTVDDTATGNYAMFMSFVSDGTTYYNLSSTAYNLTAASIEAFQAEGTAIPEASFSFTDVVNDPKTSDISKGSAGGGWFAAAPVPEPATGALALAGIALLLKRRKAAKA